MEWTFVRNYFMSRRLRSHHLTWIGNWDWMKLCMMIGIDEYSRSSSCRTCHSLYAKSSFWSGRKVEGWHLSVMSWESEDESYIEYRLSADGDAGQGMGWRKFIHDLQQKAVTEFCKVVSVCVCVDEDSHFSYWGAISQVLQTIVIIFVCVYDLYVNHIGVISDSCVLILSRIFDVNFHCRNNRVLFEITDDEPNMSVSLILFYFWRCTWSWWLGDTYSNME